MMIMNIPDRNDMAQNIFSEWQHSGSCYRLKDGGRNQKPQLIHTQLHVPDMMELFEMFFFKHSIKSIIIPKTNEHWQPRDIVSCQMESFCGGLGFGY